MQVTCPSCVRVLAVPDQYAGRKARCPRCQHVFEIPADTAIMAEQPAELPPLPAPALSAPTHWQGVQERLPAASLSCPECGVALAASAADCPACGWFQGQQAARQPAWRPPVGEGGYCYLCIEDDDVKLSAAINKRLQKLIVSEQLDLRILEYEMPPEQLGNDDLVVAGRVKTCDYGSQAMRYFFTFLALIGPGSCRLAVQVMLKSAAAGKHKFKAVGRRCVGDSGTALMDDIVETVSARIAYAAARHASGRRFLNAQAYSCAVLSLVLGLASLIPFAGVLFAVPGLITGILASTTISGRQLPRGKGLALAGIILSVLGVLITAGVIVLLVVTRRR